MAVKVDPEQLAAMCFHRVPSDVVGRDVVLAALWHLHIAAIREGLRTRTFRHPLLGQRSGLDYVAFRGAIAELTADGLLFRARNAYGLTSRGHRAVREIVDVDRVIAIERENARRQSDPDPATRRSGV